MSRLQLALNVDDLDASIDFYTKLFGTAPVKVKPGYANFAVAEPSLKLVLIENPGAKERLNHLGVEVASTTEVVAETRRLGERMPVRVEEGTECCYALQDKVWVSGPDRTVWEVYTVLADDTGADAATSQSQCCATTSNAANTPCCTGGATETVE